MNVRLVLPVLVPLVTALLCFFARRSQAASRALSVAGAIGLVGAGTALLVEVEREGILAVQIGDWPAPYGISLVADLFSALMVLVASIVGLAVVVFSLASVELRHEALGYHALVHVLLMGVCGAFVTGDVFNLYVWFEVMLIASFVLLALGGERTRMEGAIKYVTLNFLSSAFFLAGVGLLYGMAGSLNIAHLATRLAEVSRPGLVLLVGSIFLVAFGIKAAVFPLFFWLPDSYHVAPAPVGALFAGLLTKVGVYAMVRVFTILFVGDPAWTRGLLLGVAGLTMVTGVLGAFAQADFRRVLSFHIVSQIGYMVLGLAIGTPLALAGTVFYVVHHILVKTNLFLVSGVCFQLRGTQSLRELGGLYVARPLLAFLFLVPALSLAGVPPSSGFFAKLILVQAGLEAGRFAIVAVALAVSLLTLLSMTKVWSEAFWKAAPEPWSGPLPSTTRLLPPIAALAAASLWIGLAGEPLLALSIRASEQLLDPTRYVEAVLGSES